MHTIAASSRFGRNLTDTLTAVGAPLLFGLRLWASVCLALFVAFWLELDNPFWAGSSAAIVCLPQLGASLRKGRFRKIGSPFSGFWPCGARSALSPPRCWATSRRTRHHSLVTRPRLSPPTCLV